MRGMAEPLHVILDGDLAGYYVVEEQLEGGRVVLAPDASYPSVFPKLPGREATDEEFCGCFGELDHDDEP